MHIGVVNAALAAINDELYGQNAPRSVPVDRLHLVMNDKPASKTQPDLSSPGAESTKTNPAFDSWLETKLHKMFDAVASEPLPPDLVKLLEQLDKKTQGEPGKTS